MADDMMLISQVVSVLEKCDYFINSSSCAPICSPERFLATISPDEEIRKFDRMKRIPDLSAAGLCLSLLGEAYFARNAVMRIFATAQ